LEIATHQGSELLSARARNSLSAFVEEREPQNRAAHR
jgi:hypothetical protein